MKTWKKKTVGIITGMTLTVGLLAPTQIEAIEFKDVHPSNLFYNSLANLYHMNIISGYNVNENPYQGVTIKPNSNVTRAQASKMISVATGLGHATQGTSSFADVKESYWGHDYITLLHEAGVVSGFSPTSFKPNDGLKRVEAAKMIADAFDLTSSQSYKNEFSDVATDYWGTKYINALLKNGITIGTSPTTFSPHDQVSRAELAAFINRTIESKEIAELSDQQILLLAYGKYNELSMTVMENIIKTDNGETPVPFDSFKNDVRKVVTANYEPKVKAIYDSSCRSCDVYMYGKLFQDGFNLVFKEKTENIIHLSAVSPANALEGNILVDLQLVKENGQFKINTLTQTFHKEGILNINEIKAKNYAEKSFRSYVGYYDDSYQSMTYKGKSKDEYLFHGIGQRGEYTIIVNAKSGHIEIEK